MRVYALVSAIPAGRVSTYGALAGALGDRRAARAVGLALKQNPTPVVVPCHRVVCTGGRVGGYSGGVKEKVRLLGLEGVEVEDGRVVGFVRVLFNDFKAST